MVKRSVCLSDPRSCAVRSNWALQSWLKGQTNAVLLTTMNSLHLLSRTEQHNAAKM